MGCQLPLCIVLQNRIQFPLCRSQGVCYSVPLRLQVFCLSLSVHMGRFCRVVKSGNANRVTIVRILFAPQKKVCWTLLQHWPSLDLTPIRFGELVYKVFAWSFGPFWSMLWRLFACIFDPFWIDLCRHIPNNYEACFFFKKFGFCYQKKDLMLPGASLLGWSLLCLFGKRVCLLFRLSWSLIVLWLTFAIQ